MEDLLDEVFADAKEELGISWSKRLNFNWVYGALGVHRGKKISSRMRFLADELADKLEAEFGGVWESTQDGPARAEQLHAAACRATPASSSAASTPSASTAVPLATPQYGWPARGADYSGPRTETDQGIWGLSICFRIVATSGTCNAKLFRSGSPLDP